MPGVLKVTVSLPVTLHRAAERERKARKESRSQFFRSAIEALLEQQRERQASEQYVAGYLALPETEAEVSAVHRLSQAVLASEPWE